MPKRGGGGGQRYNNNNGGGMGGGGGSGGNSGGGGGGGGRYSALKDFDDADDHQRRKDRNKRRVSFKPFPHKKDVKLRVEDARRLWDEDDDMTESTSMVKDRPSSRRRGSPIPRGKFAKLMQNSYGWYQVTVS